MTIENGNFSKEIEEPYLKNVIELSNQYFEEKIAAARLINIEKEDDFERALKPILETCESIKQNAIKVYEETNIDLKIIKAEPLRNKAMDEAKRSLKAMFEAAQSGFDKFIKNWS